LEPDHGKAIGPGSMMLSLALLLASTPLQARSQSQPPDSIANYHVLEDWCVKIVKANLPTWKRAIDFCNLTPDDNLSPEEWAKWFVQPPVRASELRKAYDAARGGESELKFTASDETPKVSFDQSTILWGIADFVVGRARENLNEYALSRFLEPTCRPKQAAAPKVPNKHSEAELSSIRNADQAATIAGYLQSTCKVLLSFEQGGPLPSLASLRDAARVDLELLPKHFLQQQAMRSDPAPGDAVVTAYMVTTAAYALREGKKLLPALAAAQAGVDLKKILLDCEKTPVAAATFMFATIAEQLSAGPPLSDEFGKRRTQYGFALKAILHNLAYTGMPWPTCGGTGQERFKWLREIYGVVLALDRSLVTIADLRRSPDASGNDTPETVRTLTVLDGLFEVADALLRITPSGPASLAEPVKSIRNAVTALARQQLGSVIYWTAAAGVQLSAVDSPALDAVRPYLMLIVDVAQAESSEAVASALARAAAPRHSFMRKRQERGKVYASVNAYLGGAFGWERVQDASLSNSQRSSNFVAPYLPIGIEAGISLGKEKFSLGLMAQLLDLGALGSYRLQSKAAVQQEPEISLRQVFSPSLTAMLGIGKIPLSAGIQLFGYSPRLRRIDKGGTTEERGVTRRFAFLLAMDVPIF